MDNFDKFIFELKKEFKIFLIKENLYIEFKEILKDNINDLIIEIFINKIKDIDFKEYTKKILKKIRSI